VLNLRIMSILFGVALLLSTASSAFSHANFESSDPAPDATVMAPPATVTIWFTEDVQAEDTWIRVFASDGTRVDMENSWIQPSNERELTVGLRSGLARGTYTVSWQNVAKADGHGQTGSFRFGIGEAPMAMDDHDHHEEMHDHDHNQMGGDHDHDH
jgi:methionine-rich copper-binding protein CopC